MKFLVRMIIGVMMIGAVLAMTSVAGLKQPKPTRSPYQIPSASPEDALIHQIEQREEMDQIREQKAGR